MREAFLINPVRRRRSRVSKRFGRSKSKLPKALLSRMMKEHGSGGMAAAWKAYRKGIYKNPLSEEVLVVGSNPRRKRSKRHVRRTILSSRAPRRRHRRKRHSFFANPVSNPRRRARRSRRIFMDNPRKRYTRRHRRSFRHNPVMSSGAINFRKPMTLVMPIATGLAAQIATKKLPGMIGVSSALPKLGVQVGVMLAGNMFLKGFLGSQNAMIWTVVSGVTIASDLLNKYVFKNALAWVEETPYSIGSGVAAYPVEYAAPQQLSSDLGMGAYPFEETVSY